jgi:hypothetical protein
MWINRRLAILGRDFSFGVGQNREFGRKKEKLTDPD